MRVQHWIKPVLGTLLMLASSRAAVAQYTSDPYDSPGVATVPSQPASLGHDHSTPSHSYYEHALVAPDAYGGYPPAYTPVAAYPYPEGYGPTMQPWPEISPFETAYSSHYLNGGLWEHAQRGFGKRFYASAEYLSTRTRKPEGIVGDTNTQSYFSQVFPGDFSLLPGQGSGGTGGDDGGDGGDGGGTGGSGSSTDLADVNYYNRLDLHALGDIFGKGGRFSFGWWNPDDSGFGVGFWFTGDSTEVFDARDDATRVSPNLDLVRRVLSPPDFFLSDIGQHTLDDLLEANLLNLRGLPVNDGTEAGLVIPYDLFFQVTTRSQSLGGNLDHYLTPIIQRKNIKVRPMLGARYLMIDEGFDFVGVDSGILYTSGSGGDTPIRDLKTHSFPNGVDDNNDGIVDNAGLIESVGDDTGGGGGGGGGGDGGGEGEDVLFEIPNDGLRVSPFLFTTASVDVDTLSHLFGPQFGLRYDLGGEKFKVWGETKFGLMVNRENIKLRGDNIGSITRFNGHVVSLPDDGEEEEGEETEFIENDQGLIEPTVDNPHPNAFKDEESHVHFSPLFEQSIFCEMNIFGYVPVLKNIHILEEARFRVGYTFIWANEIVTTDQSIVWDGKPTAGLFPHIDLERETWWTSNYSFGVSWDF